MDGSNGRPPPLWGDEESAALRDRVIKAIDEAFRRGFERGRAEALKQIAVAVGEAVEVPRMDVAAERPRFPERRRTGPPSKMTAERQEAALRLLDQGLRAASVAGRIGVSQSTLYVWLRRRERQKEQEQTMEVADA